MLPPARTLTLVLGFIVLASRLHAAPPDAGEAPAPEQTLREGVALHDRGDYDGALVKFRQVLALDPKNAMALYESSLSLAAKKDWPGCIAAAEAALALSSPYRQAYYVAAGSCRDSGGDRKGAIKVFRKGLREFPDDAQIGFNLAVTYANGGDADEAEKTLEGALRSAPSHPSANYLLAQIYDNRNQRVPALLSYLGYLGIDARSERAKTAALAVRRLLGQGVHEKSENKIELTISSDALKGDLSPVDLLLSLQASTRSIEENKDKTDIQFLAETLALLADSGGEQGLPTKKRCFSCRQYLPFLLELKAKGWIEPFTYIAFATLDLPGALDWRTAHSAQVEEVRKWLEER